MNRLRLAVVACLAACAGCLTDAENSGRWYKGALYASDRIGATAKCVTGAKGEAVTASYALGADDLYVRARIESTEPSRLKGEHLKPRVKAAWTQPYRR